MNREEIQEAAVKATEGRKRCGLGISMGVGKTLIGLMHMEKNTLPLQSKLVVGPTKAILNSWKAEAEKFNKTHLLVNTTFVIYRSLCKLNPADYDFIYFDEMHNLLDSHRPFLSNSKAVILGLSGTPPKSNSSEKGRMVAEFCPIVYTYLFDTAVDDNILNDYHIFVHQLSMSTENNYLVTTKNKSWYASEVKNYNYWTEKIAEGGSPKTMQIFRIMRMKAMMEYPSKEVYTKALMKHIKDKCIIFANTMKQADRLCEHSYHSDNPNSETNLKLFEEDKILDLSCVLQLSEGKNIPRLKQGIILHAYGNERKASQRIGRMARLNVDDKSTIHVLCYKDSIDVQWVTLALEGFDQTKITWLDCE